jgi:enoyl-[acyl-carrier-protein] reductase (NADH)
LKRCRNSNSGINRFAATFIEKQSADEFERDFFRSVRPTSLLQRFASVDEVAHMGTYLCSPLTNSTNGAALRVDGGVLRGTL